MLSNERLRDLSSQMSNSDDFCFEGDFRDAADAIDELLKRRERNRTVVHALKLRADVLMRIKTASEQDERDLRHWMQRRINRLHDLGILSLSDECLNALARENTWLVKR